MLSPAGLGSAAGRSIQCQFDDAIACLQLTLAELGTAHDIIVNGAWGSNAGLHKGAAAPEGALAGGDSSSGGSGRVPQQAAPACSAGGDEPQAGSPSQAAWLQQSQTTAAAVAEKLAEWRLVVASHQSASRVLRWSSPAAGL